jgi:hypothetical protein
MQYADPLTGPLRAGFGIILPFGNDDGNFFASRATGETHAL